MPAAAVIPAPIAYIKVVAVKKLVVGSRGEASPVRRELGEHRPARPSLRRPAPPVDSGGGAERGAGVEGGNLLPCPSPGPGPFTLRKLECSKRARTTFSPLNTSAWDNGIGPRSYFRWFPGAG